MEAIEHALVVVNNWRSSHSYPVNTFQMGLRQRVARVDDRGPLVSQRIKRLAAIKAKLVRFESMDLARMHDIGGCRAVVASIPKVQQLVDSYLKSDMKHELKRNDDYIREPKDDGYRGIHLIYAHQSSSHPQYNGLRIEVQIRTQLQHAWAAAVETVGTMLQQSLKSHQGEAEWLRFFALMGTAMALRERAPRVPNTPWRRAEFIPELRQLAAKLNVAQRLRGYGAALSTKMLEHPDLKNAHFFLVQLDPKEHQTMITGFVKTQQQEATDMYLKVERDIADTPGAEAVLVSVSSLKALRRAYPSYFLDTNRFLQALQRAIASRQ